MVAGNKGQIQKRLEELGLTMSLATEVLSLFSPDAETGGEVALSLLDTVDPSEMAQAVSDPFLAADGSCFSNSSMLAGSSRYEEQGLLGIGGMGMVLRVRDLMLARTVAMKVLHQRAARQCCG